MASRLTEQQSFLLRRLPNWYSVKNTVDVIEPSEIKRARATVQRYDDRVRRQEKGREKRFNELLTKAREAVYFLTPEKALKVVQDFEKKFPTAKDNG
jgi:hypothetical protein